MRDREHFRGGPVSKTIEGAGPAVICRLSPESRGLHSCIDFSGGNFWLLEGVAASKLRESASRAEATPGKRQMPNVAEMRYRWEDTELQADLTMGNLASALTLQSEEAALIA